MARLLDIATQYGFSRHPLAPVGETWARSLFDAAHGDTGDPDVPGGAELAEWFEAVEAIIEGHRLDVIRSRYSPSPAPHTGVAGPDVTGDRWARIGAGVAVIEHDSPQPAVETKTGSWWRRDVGGRSGRRR